MHAKGSQTVRERANYIIDTTALSTAKLRDTLRNLFASEEPARKDGGEMSFPLATNTDPD